MISGETTKSGASGTNRRVLALYSKGAGRNPVLKSFASAGFKVSFASSTQEAVALLADTDPIMFIHEYSAVDESQGRAMQQRLARQDDHISLLRILVVEKINSSILAFANDTGIAWVITSATARLGLAREVEMLIAGHRNTGGFRAIQREVSENRNAYDQSKIDETIREAWKQYPHDPVVKIEFGGLKYREDDMDEAIRVATELVEEDPNNVRAMNLLGRAHMKKGDFAKATKILSRANSLSPANPERLVLMGDAFYGNGDIELAEKCYEQAGAVDPGNKGADAGLGKVSISRGDYDQALSLFKDSLSEEEAAGYFNNAAVVAARENHPETALKLYGHALNTLKTKSYKAKVHFNMYLTLMRMGKREQAKQSLEKSVRADRKFAKAAAHLKALEAEDPQPKKKPTGKRKPGN